jgi:mannose-6-phosphate isomerase-like protein (cupin superfamily)
LALKNNPSEDFFISPSDHYISVNKKFHDSCSLSRDQIKKDALILMGIKPDRPSVEYGYISIEKSSQEAKRVLDFIEKPNLAKSKELISQSNVYWNGGMFIFNGLWFIKQLEKFDKKMYTDISDIVSLGLHTSNIFIPDKSKFKNIKNISFDSAFVEKNDKTLMTILDAGWSDLGSWVSLGALQRDPDNAMSISTENVYERLVKPWGFFEILMETLTSKVKLLSVSPGERLSLQKHEHRMETWYIIKGTAKVTRGVERFTLQVGDSIIIEKNQIHRLENDSEENLEVIEIQTGNYFGEDDIVRIEDSYGRAGLH